MPALGKKMYSYFASISGRSDLDDKKLIQDLCEIAGMSPVENNPPQWVYPTSEGLGGVGRTTFLPITESFIVIDSWPHHDGRYLVLCSCKPFQIGDIHEYFQSIGLDVRNGTTWTAEL